MIYTYLSGRLGNNLFQLAAATAHAHRNNTEFMGCIKKIWCSEPDNCFLEEYLQQFHNTILRKIKLTNSLPEQSIVFDEVNHVSKIPFYENMCLHGLWQSENYFVKERDIILELFSMDEATHQFIKNKYGSIFNDEVISIVVRRGDYCKQPQFHPTCSLKYYQNAINYFGKNKRYLIISDDIAWCKTKFKGSNFFFSDHDGPIVDLFLQTLCSHNIISNSTFAWWGAWLNNNSNKVVIAPGTNWYGYYYKNFYRNDMLPENWIKLPNPLSTKHKLKILFAIFITNLLPVKKKIEKVFKIKIKLSKI